MPILTEENKTEELAAENNVVLDATAEVNPEPVADKKGLKLPKKVILALIFVVFVFGGLYIFTSKFNPGLLGKMEAKPVETPHFEIPINIDQITFPNDVYKNKFLENMRAAESEKDTEKRYKFLEDDFTLLRGLYTSTAKYDYRVPLEKFRSYMQKSYPKKVKDNLVLYEFPCIDKLCKGGEIASEIREITAEIDANKVLDPSIKEVIKRNFDSAAHNSDKNFQGNMYTGALSMLVSEYNRTKDEDLKKITNKLLSYIISSYPEITIPNALKI